MLVQPEVHAEIEYRPIDRRCRRIAAAQGEQFDDRVGAIETGNWMTYALVCVRQKYADAWITGPERRRTHPSEENHNHLFLYSFSNPKSVIRRLAALLTDDVLDIFRETVDGVSCYIVVIVVPRAQSSSLSIDWAMLLTCGVGRFGSSVTLA